MVRLSHQQGTDEAAAKPDSFERAETKSERQDKELHLAMLMFKKQNDVKQSTKSHRLKLKLCVFKYYLVCRVKTHLDSLFFSLTQGQAVVFMDTVSHFSARWMIG